VRSISGNPARRASVPAPWNYASPGLQTVHLEHLFPHLSAGDRAANDWPYLRREVPHVWYVDSRFPTMGFLSTDEATLLHALAKPFAGKRALEIGCWRGWSTAHLLAAGVVLDVIDPVLVEPAAYDELATIAHKLGAGNRTTLHSLPSPQGIAEAAKVHGEPWTFIFIDGDHEPPGPVLDALSVTRYAADDAMMVFHDLASPFVAAGLDSLRELGWSTRVYQTMQVMGVAWRGAVEPVVHIPDPKVSWSIPEHLAGYGISGEDERTRQQRFQETIERHSALIRELALARLVAQMMPLRSGLPADFWEGKVAAPADMAPPYLSATGRELFEELENCWTAMWDTIGKTENEVSRVNLDYVGALQSVYQLNLELADARSEIARILQTLSEREAEHARTLSERETEHARTLSEREAEHARMRAEIIRLAPFANRAGRSQAEILRWLRAHKLLRDGP
jgi:predicted O-methyltransferase YrrM